MEVKAANGNIYLSSKRLLDVTASLCGILVLLPLYVTIAIIIKITSEGPILYRGIRTGFKGNQFKILKFRSMLLGADLGASTTSRNDSRVTPVGKFIRKYKIDETPQLFNVLKGDMSLVGPRPELPMYTNQYTQQEKIILDVLPGITDFSSIEFSNLNDLIDDSDPDKSFEELVLVKKNKLRVRYAIERSFLLDLKLILLTISSLLRP
ncbi:MAG: sugar transferase [Pseudomonadales bacterium]|nr:sugar transferase [Pseudomonadales bacterium]